jgi:hypothetical protein
MTQKSPQDRPDYTILSKLWNIGGGIVFLTWGGWWLDQKFHIFPVLTLVGAALGILYCCYEIWRVLNR